MPPIGPISQRKLIKNLRKLGWDGPDPGGKHPAMTKGDMTISIPNPHGHDIDRGLLLTILAEAGIDRADWEALK